MKTRQLLTILTLGLGLTLALGLFTFIGRAAPDNPVLHPPRNSHTAPPTVHVTRSPQQTPTDGLTADEWDSIQEQIRQVEYHYTWHEPNGAYTAPNRANGWHTILSATGAAIAPLFPFSRQEAGEGSDWHWKLALVAYGYEDHLLSVAANPTQTVDGDTVAYHWDDNLTEWYVNGESGLEQGFTIQSPPLSGSLASRSGSRAAAWGALRRRGTPSLLFEMALDTNLNPAVADEGQTIRFDAGDEMILRYADLHVYDNAGKELAAYMRLTNLPLARLQLVVDDTTATYPLTVASTLYSQVKFTPLLATDRGDLFGQAVALSGTTAIIGAPGGVSGSVYVFEYTAGGWSQQAKLTAADGDIDDNFGGSVAISGDTVVIGASWDEDPNGDSAGSVYVFEKGSGWSDGHANQSAKLDPDDGDSYDYFGYSVAISGDTVIVGAFGDEDPNGSEAGSVYVFEKGSGWSDGHTNQTAKLDPDDGDIDDNFGGSVAISGDTVVVGAYYDENPNGSGAGSVYMFEKGSGWSDGHANQSAKLDPDDGDSGDWFGQSVAISGDTVVVGAVYDEDPNSYKAGSVYVFEKGSGWSDGHANQSAKLDPDDGGNVDQFGGSVAASGDTVVVGAVYDANPNGSDGGSVYVFEKGSGWSDGHANQAAKLFPDDGDNQDWFAKSVAISDNTVVVGAYLDERSDTNTRGSVYVFEKGSGWSDGYTNQQTKLLPDVGQEDVYGDRLGWSVAISDDTVVVGARSDAVNGPDSGSVYVFEYTAGSWSQQARLDPDDGDSKDYFGRSVAISGDTVVVGAVYDKYFPSGRVGSVYVFEKGSGWSDGHANQIAKLDPDDGDNDDFFGRSVAISGDTVIVGADRDEHPNGDSAGSVYVFEKGSGWSDGHANQTAKLDPDDGDSSDKFGRSVAINGDTILVGAFGDEDPNGDSAGSVYVFEKGSGWSDGHANQTAKLDPDDGDSSDHFGWSVAISGDTVVVGAYWDEDPNSGGSAYIFEKGSGWSDGHANQAAKLDPDDGADLNRFGWSVAINDDTVVVGAPDDRAFDDKYTDSVYVFEKGSGWSDGHVNQQAKLALSDRDDYDYFGYAVAISGDTVVVGMPGDDEAARDAGAVYVFAPAPCDLRIIKTVAHTTPVKPGGTITYTLTFSNSGGIPAANVVITDRLPISVTNTSVVSSGVEVTQTNVGIYTYTWAVQDLAPGDEGVITITCVLSNSLLNGHTFTNTAVIATTAMDRNPHNNSSSAAVTAPSADLSIAKTTTPTTPTNPDQIIAYILTFSNNGTLTATDVVITDTVPSSVTVSNVANSGAVITDTGFNPSYVWQVQDLAPGKGGIITITGVLSDSLPNGYAFTNTATIATTAVDGDLSNNHDDATIIVTTEAELEVNKEVDNSTPNEDNTIIYTITVTNNGPLDASGVVISDTLPSGITYVSDSGGDYNDTTRTWTVGNLDNGSSIALHITATVDAGTAGDTITNTAVIVASDQSDPVASNNQADAVITVFAEAGEDWRIYLPLVVRDYSP